MRFQSILVEIGWFTENEARMKRVAAGSQASASTIGTNDAKPPTPETVLATKEEKENAFYFPLSFVFRRLTKSVILRKSLGYFI